MRARPLALAAVALLVGGFGLAGGRAAAKDEPKAVAPAASHLRYAKSCAEAMAEARERGCVIFATYHGDG